DHNRIALLMIRMNQFHVSKGGVVFFLTNMPTNVYLISMLFFRLDLDGVILFLVCCFVLAQIGAPFVVTIPLMALTKSYYSSETTVLSLITKQRLILRKLKTAFYYERLRTNEKINFTMGAVGEVTSFFTFKVIF